MTPPPPPPQKKKKKKHKKRQSWTPSGKAFWISVCPYVKACAYVVCLNRWTSNSYPLELREDESDHSLNRTVKHKCKLIPKEACADPENFVRRGQILTKFVYEGRENPNTTISGRSSARQRRAIKMAFRWRVDVGPSLKTGLVV